MDESGVESNNILSQSYAQGLQRIAPHKGTLEFFHIPTEIIEEREETWDKLCKKYSQELTDEIEITIDSPSDEEEEEEEPDEEDEEEEEGDEEEDCDDKYFSKSRTPIRKSKDLIQYWIDTGNPPYQLMNDNQKSDTGSSLSEAESPKMGHSEVKDVSPEAVKKMENEASVYSSVDTAAYILSNTNVTKKAETMAIVEGARKSTDSIENKNLNTSLNLNNNNNKSPVDPEYASQIFSKLEEKIQRNSLNRSRTSLYASDASENEKVSEDLPKSMETTDVLPSLKQLDNLITNSNGLKVSDGSRESSRTPTFSLSKKFNRRKLYTGRSSPMDIIVSSSINDNPTPRATNIHPAFQRTPALKKRSSFKRKSIANKRLSKVHSDNSQDKNSNSLPKASNEKIINSLKSVPSPSFNTRTKRKTISEAATRRVAKKKLMKKLDNKKDVSSANDKSSEAFKEISNSIKSDDPLVLCAKKLLSVPLERLSESVLKKVREKNVSRITENEENIEVKKTDDSNPRNSLSKRMKNLSKIEIDSQGSDQSTIIICKCKSNTPPSKISSKSSRDSDNSRVTLLKKDSGAKYNKSMNGHQRSLRNRVLKPQIQKPIKTRKNKKLKAKKIKLRNVNNKDMMLVIARCTDSPQSATMKKNTEEGNLIKKIGSEYDSYSDSSIDKRERKINETKRRYANPIITFSSDDDSGFIKIMNRSVQKYERKLRSESAAVSKDHDLTHNTMTISAKPVELLLNKIVESDEETIDFTVMDEKSKGKSNPSSKNQKSAQTSGRTLRSIARVLSYDDASSKKSEDVESPPKKFKTENGVINKQSTKNYPEKSADSDSISSNTTMSRLFRRTRNNPKRNAASSNNTLGSNASQSSDKLFKVGELEKSPITFPLRECEVVIETPMKQLTSSTSLNTSGNFQLKELHISLQKIPVNLEKSFQKSMGKTLSESTKKSLPPVRRRSSKKRSLPSENESSGSDFHIKNNSPRNEQIQVHNDDFSDADSAKCTKLFHNPFEDSDNDLKFSFGGKHSRSKLNRNRNNISINKTLKTFRTRQDSDSDD